MGDTSATPLGHSTADAFDHHLISGGELLRRNRLEDAVGEFRRALELRPDNNKALGLLGLAYFRLADYPQAKEIYEALVQTEPDDASYRLNLGLVYLRLGDAEKAIVELEQARSLDPGMTKAVGYLGLAHARAGQYSEAYKAFIQTGQDELASEMEGHLTPEQAQAAREELGRGGTASAGVARRERAARIPPDDSTQSGVAQPAAASPPPIPAPDGSNAAATAPEESAAEADAAGDASVPGPAAASVSEAVEAATPSLAAATAATKTAVGHQPPVPLTEFATARLVRPEDGDHTFEISAAGVLIVRVRGRILSRTEGVIVSGGDLAYEPATRRVRGKATDEPLGGAGQMFAISGEGHLVASPLSYHFEAITLDDEVLYLREDLVFAFEEHLRWENGHVPGADVRISVLQFRGRGSLALRTRRPCLGVKLSPSRTLYVDTDVLAGWVGRVVPRVVAPAAGGESSALFVECSGEGVVLLEDQDPQDLEE